MLNNTSCFQSAFWCSLQNRSENKAASLCLSRPAHPPLPPPPPPWETLTGAEHFPEREPRGRGSGLKQTSSFPRFGGYSTFHPR